MEYHAYTTLNEIRELSPCRKRWEKLLSHLGKTQADDEPLHLVTILESNGISDAVWCLDAKSLERLSRHFKAWCCEQILHNFEAVHPDDFRVRNQISMLRNDDAMPALRTVAQEGARLALRKAKKASAQRAARAAACKDAWLAAWEVAWDYGRDAQEKQLRLMIGEDV